MKLWFWPVLLLFSLPGLGCEESDSTPDPYAGIAAPNLLSSDQWYLPFPAQTTVLCTQSLDIYPPILTHEHSLRAAYDFAYIPGQAPGEKTIVSMRPGTVVKIDNSVPGPVQNSMGNYIIIRGQDGTYDLYAHLKQNSLVVAVNQVVAQGEALAEMGNTGQVYSTETGGSTLHLHVQVMATSILTDQSIYFGFHDSSLSSEGGIPKPNRTYISQNPGN